VAVGARTEMGNMNDLFTNKSKEEIAIERIKTFCPPEGYYVAFSGGKDSVVILDLVKRAGVKFDAHYNMTTVDPPELVRFIKTFPEVEIRRPEKTMWQIIEKNGLPTRWARFCCRWLKEGGGMDRFVVTGVRWQESVKRSKRKMVEACYVDSRKHYLHCIIDWSNNDVWEYIKQNNIKYCNLYDEGWKRLGCIMCPNSDMKKQALRWPRYEQLYKKALHRFWESRTQEQKDRYALELNWHNADDYYAWWIEGKSGKQDTDPDQTVMFE
jgi:phosphoadenosine phosphosulfate reductase